IAPVLEVESGRKLGRADQIAEHDGDRTPLDRIEPRERPRRRSRRRPGGGRRWFGRGKLRYRPKQAPAVAEGDPEFLEVAVGEILEHIAIDPVIPERLLVLAEPEAPEPRLDVQHHGLAPQSLPRSAVDIRAETAHETARSAMRRIT